MLGVAGGVKRGEMVMVGEDAIAGVYGGMRRDRLGATEAGA